MRKISFLSLIVALSFFSCSDETIVFEQQEDSISLESDQNVLENSIVLDNAGVIDIIGDTTDTSGKNSFTDQANGHPLTLVGQVSPPSFRGGENLTASHVDLQDNYAYVSYNTVAESYAGGIDIVDISDPHNPILTSRLYYLNADLSALKYDNGYIYAVGGFNSEQSATIDFNSFVAKIAAQNGRFNTRDISYGFQEGFVATDVETTDNEVIVVSGKDGLVVRYQKSSLDIINEVPYSDLRAIELKEDKIGVLDADYGVRVLDQSLNQIASIAIDADFRLADKRTLTFTDDKVIVAEGSSGAGVYNYSTGQFLERVPIVDYDFRSVSQSEVVTNAVSTNEDVLLMANGAAGLCLSENKANANSIEIVGVIDFDGSANYVVSKGDYIFAASGTKGLQIIKLNRPEDILAEYCKVFPEYSGSGAFIVESDETLRYGGSGAFSRIRVKTDGDLYLCGTWTISRALRIDTAATFGFRGKLEISNNARRNDVIVAEDAVLHVEGDLTIYGDLILQAGATLRFSGSTDNSINVFGDVVIDPSATVTGDFDDIQGKF